MFTSHNEGRFFIAQSHVSYMVVMAWVSNSIPGSSSKRAVALALVTMFATLGYEFSEASMIPLMDLHAIAATCGPQNGARHTPSHSSAASWHFRYPLSCYLCIDGTSSGSTRKQK